MVGQGYVRKGVGGFYTVRSKNEDIICKARGRFRLDGISPLCGDRVVFETQNEGHALLCEILPRKNLLARPPVANIDQLVIVLSASAPRPDLMLCDKLLIAAALHEIEPLIIINKCDDGPNKNATEAAKQYEKNYRTIFVSAQTGYGMQQLYSALDGVISCFAGQSAVGKSSLLNSLFPELELEVGGLAKKTERGRHTTRHAELWPYLSGAVLDTAGFSLLELPLISQEELNLAYREFGSAPERCRFAACAHISEPDCAVKELIGENGLSPERYKRYVELSRQFEEMRRHCYD
ncbi:ribosome small subunit-dependent GTPase A [Eubacteriales bacterium OttesenSCG-928-K08]|nr:ribosome small subunit-dependent GTPase A [Eubacteriales bacterium OttesenSCG-928-K08]